MTRNPDGLVLGTPRFNDTVLMQTAAGNGLETAWRQAFQKLGAKAAEIVSGDFAVALRQSDGNVFLAIDRFAIRSLCYRQVGDQLLFAERADELADANTEVDPQAIFDYLYFHVIPSPRTIFKGIYRVPPAHYVLFENSQLTIAPYWTPTFKEVLDQPFDKLRDEFRALLQQATARQLDDGKAACFLSGGTDSSTVAGMIGLAHGAPAATYSIGFEAEGYDEMAFARIAASRFNTEHHEYYVTPDDLVCSIPMVAASYDQPFGNSSALPAYYCAKMAKEDGVTRILAGDGGDELFGGNARYAKQRVFDWYQHIPGAVRKGIMEPLLGTKSAGALPLIRKASSYVEQASVPMPDRLQMYNLITRLGLEQTLTPDFLAQVNVSLPLEHQRQVWASARTTSNTNRELAFDWRYTLAEIDLPKVTGTTRLAGVQVGFPMLDSDLLDFSLRLPDDYKLKGLKLRWFFKEALRGFLPDEIITKKKQGFGLPFGVWLIRHDALRLLARNSVFGLVDRGIIRGEFAENLFSKHLQEHPGYYGEMIWISMMLEQWLQTQRAGYKVCV
ncbi:MAG: asparagine synthase [Dechloromonas sp.]|uniref:asparagine synthase (glutamine-hydrolyzing) n=1 Tax=Candidatus Dechloromonas phosphorivorans TaxID=2899244 RepID=A0A9D7LP27_9RHOO|nr:asparagine synthase [Candidatus Dechloromonas phosphorivorans]